MISLTGRLATLALMAMVSIAPTQAHMGIYHPSVFGFRNNLDQFSPLGPNAQKNQWWFRGSEFTKPESLPDPKTNSSLLVPGGKVEFDIACHRDFTRYGNYPTVPGSKYDACPDPGPYHADHDARTIVPELVSGCALGIADVTSPDQVTMENMAIFSVQPDCVTHKVTQFDIPKNMASCTGEYCVCAWFWLPKTGTPNFYMSGFYCKVPGGSTSTKIAKPQTPVHCGKDSSKCVQGAKSPIYVYNTPANIPGTLQSWPSRWNYVPEWGFQPGPQEDIFERREVATTVSNIPTIPAATTTRVAVATCTGAVTTVNGPGVTVTSTVERQVPVTRYVYVTETKSVTVRTTVTQKSQPTCARCGATTTSAGAKITQAAPARAAFALAYDAGSEGSDSPVFDDLNAPAPTPDTYLLDTKDIGNEDDYKYLNGGGQSKDDEYTYKVGKIADTASEDSTFSNSLTGDNEDAEAEDSYARYLESTEETEGQGGYLANKAVNAETDNASGSLVEDGDSENIYAEDDYKYLAYDPKKDGGESYNTEGEGHVPQWYRKMSRFRRSHRRRS